ncbi:hypothetical protein HL92_002989 [Salmonella enterica]|nr:hypothetical protein [Salmonella enterica subsp. arizonae]EHN2305358.1 hypothetical protein [Salmonella enterica]
MVNRLSKGWINRRKRTYTLSSYPPSHSFDTFDLYQSPNNPNKRVIITAHGMQTLRGKSAYLPKGVSFRYYSSDGNALYDPGLMRMALGPEYNTPRETLNGPGRIRNYQLERYPHDTPQEITKVVNTMEVDIIAITKNTSLRHVLKVLDQNNLNYSVIEGCFCRSSLKASILDFLKIAEVPVQSVERH